MRQILTQAEFDFIFENKDKMTQTEIAKKINRTDFTVSFYLNKKNPKPPKIKPLTQLEINFILDNKGKMLQKQIATCLHVTPACVNKIIKKHKQGKLVKMEGYLDLEDFAKQYAL